jgi:hypothetical protein
MSSNSNLINVPSNEHVMFLYNNDDARNNAVVNYFNEGLKNGFHCIYASVDAYDSESSSNISNLSPKLTIIKKILKEVNYVLLILSLITSQHLM